MLKRLFALLSMLAIVLLTVAIDLAYAAEAFLTSAPPDVLLSRVLGRPVRPEQIARDALGRDVRIGRIEVPGWSEVHRFLDLLQLRAVVVHDVGIPSVNPPAEGPRDLLTVERVELHVDRFALIEKRVVPTEIVLDGLALDLVPGADGKLELVKLIDGLSGGPSAGPPPLPPSVTLHRARLRVQPPAVLRPDHVHEITDLELRLRPISDTAFLVDATFDLGVLNRWTLRGEYDLATRAARIHMETKALRLGAEVYDLLTPGIQHDWNNYKPNGVVDLTVDLDLTEKDATDEQGKPIKKLTPAFLARMTLRGLEMTYKNFAYPVLVESGTAELRHDGFRLVRLSGKSTLSTTRLLLDGEADGYEKADGLHLRISLDDVTLDRHIRAALQEDDQQSFDLFAPSGKVRAFCDVRKEPGVGKKAINHMMLTCEDVTLTFKSFPYTLSRVQGGIEFLEKEIVARDVVGFHGDTKFRISGAILGLGGDGGGFDMTIDAAPVMLNRTLRGAFEPEMQAVWDLFRPGGTMDVRWRTTRAPGKDQPIRHHIKARCLDVSASYVETPYPLQHITGDILFEPGLVTLRDLHGVSALRDSSGMGSQARVELDGTVRLGEPAPTVDLMVRGKEVPIDAALLAAVPAGLSEMVREIEGKGVIDFGVKVRRAPAPGAGGDARATGQPVPTITNYAGDVQMFDTSFSMGLGFDSVYGNLLVQGALGPRGNEALGQISLKQARMEGKRITDTRTNFVYREGRISLLDLSGTAYDGLIRGDLSIGTVTKDFSGSFRVNGLGLAAFTRDTFISGRDVTGTLSGALELAGKGFDKQALTGSGSLRLEQCQLWDVPVFLSILKGASLSQRQEFQSGTVQFKLRDGVANLSEFVFEGEDMEVKGKGTMDLSGNIHLYVDASFPVALIPSIPVISDLWTVLRKAIYAFEMTGSFKDPKMSVTLAPFLSGSDGPEPEPEAPKKVERPVPAEGGSSDGRREHRR